MKNYNVITNSVHPDDLVINRNEAAVRLKVPRNFENETIDFCESRLRQNISPKFAFIKTDVKLFDDHICRLSSLEIKSRDLYNNLIKSQSAYIFGCTLGYNTDRLIKKLSLVSPAESFITDALASAYAEALCEYADNCLREKTQKSLRYAPGYGDFSINYQPKILDMIDACNTLGITLNSALLMTPIKSVTAIMGEGGAL